MVIDAVLSILLLTYPTQTPLLFLGSRLGRQWFLRFTRCSGGFGGRQPPKEKRLSVNAYSVSEKLQITRIYPTPRPSATASPRIFFNLLIYCRLHKGVKDRVSFTVSTALLGRLGLGLRVRVSIRIISHFFGIYYRLIPLKLNCNKSRYERHLSNADAVVWTEPEGKKLRFRLDGTVASAK